MTLGTLDVHQFVDALRVWCFVGTLDLLRNVGRIEELLRLAATLRAEESHQQRSNHPMRRSLAWIRGSAFVAAVLLLLILCWPIMLAIDIKTRTLLNWNRPERPTPPFHPKRRELGKCVSIEEAEARETIRDPLEAAPNVPLGFLNDRWNAFIAMRMPRDTLQRFVSERREGHKQVHREGYAWVTPMRIRAALTTAIWRRDAT